MPKGYYTGIGGPAADTGVIKIHGLEEIKARLKNLSDVSKKKAVEQALRAGGNVIKKAIQEKAPIGKQAKTSKDGKTIEPGSLKKSIVVRKRRIKWDPFNIHYQIGPDRKIAFYAHMVEFGTSRHEIRPKKGKVLRWLSGDGWVFTRKPVYVQAKRNPFVRPGFDSSKFKATNIIKEKLSKVIDKLAKKEGII